MMRLFTFFMILFLIKPVFAQLSQMRIEGEPQKSRDEIVAVRDPNGRFCAAIQVISDMDGFSYQSYNGVVEVDDQPGKDMVYLQPDERVLEVYHAGYEPLKIILSEIGIQLRPRKVWVLKLKGEAETLPVSVVVDPDDAEITIDGENMGSDQSFQLSVGSHRISISRKDYESISDSIYVDQDHTLFRFTLKKKQPAILVVESTPEGAELYLNGTFLGTTPYQGKVFSGNYELELKKSLYLPFKKDIRIDEEITNEMTYRLIPNFGYLKITSKPSDARVYVDNKPVGRTPFKSAPMDRGSYTVRLEKDLYYSSEKSVDVEIDTTLMYHFALSQAFGGIALDSDPHGAAVYIDGKRVGTTPYRDAQLSSGTYQVRLEKELYRDVDKQITVKDGELYEEKIMLPVDFGEVTIRTLPDAEVYVDGKLAGKGEVSTRLRGGLHEFEARLSRHNPAKRSVNVNVGDERTIELTPEPRTGKLTIFVEPKEARNAAIFIDGQSMGNAPRIFNNIYEGTHTVELKQSGFLDYRQRVTIEYNQEHEINATMMSYAGSMQAKKDRWNRRRNWTLFGTVVFAGAGAGLRWMSEQKYTDYKRATISDKAVSLRQEVQELEKYANATLIGAGVFGVWTLYNQIRKSIIQIPKESFSLKYEPEKKQLVLCINF